MSRRIGRSRFRWLLALIAASGLAMAAPAEEPKPEQEEGEQPSSFPALECYQQAIRSVDVDEHRASRLCEGADSSAPAECFVEARKHTFLTIEDAVQLCTCATSTAPVQCYARAHKDTFLDAWQILRLCSPLEAYALNPLCASRFFYPRYPY